VDRRIIIKGDPGTVWVNNTPKVRYQFVCALSNTCGACLQYHTAIGSWWPIPIHRNCGCRQRSVPPGQAAPQPFADVRKILDEMSPESQIAAVGLGVYPLLKSGVIEWGDIVTLYSVRTLEGIVAWKRLTMDEMIGAGVDPQIASAAYEAMHTPAQDAARQKREDAMEALERAGIPREKVIEELSRALLSPGEINMREIAGRLIKSRDEGEQGLQ
jgi:hypothetical protein